MNSSYAPRLRALPVGRPPLAARCVDLARRAVAGLTALAPAVDLGSRVVLAGVFFRSGLTKIANWDATLSLFDSVYAVPLLPSALAAWLGTSVELIFPVLLLLLGLSSRFAAAVLFVFNIVAVVSYPELGEVGLKDHQTWGLLLLVLLHGPGKLAIDHWIARRFAPR